MSLGFILLVFAFVCAVLAAVGAPSGRFNLIGASLAFWLASILFGGVS